MMTPDFAETVLRTTIDAIDVVKAETVNVQLLELLTIATNKLNIVVRNIAEKDRMLVEKKQLSDTWVSALWAILLPRDGV
jgi:hypothetical protein